MEEVVTIGLDIAKSVFQVHGVDSAGEAVLLRQLKRARMLPFFAKLPPCLIGIEACNNSHYWARELSALGHDVKLMPAQYVKPYVKRGKNDAADAEAICEAVTRPTMRFVAVKSPEQQSLMMLHRVRLMLNRQRTQISNAIRAHMSEFGVVAPVAGSASSALWRSWKTTMTGVFQQTRGCVSRCWFALHKLWLGAQAKRNPLRRRKDTTQGNALLDAITQAMPHYNLGDEFSWELPKELIPFFE